MPPSKCRAPWLGAGSRLLLRACPPRHQGPSLDLAKVGQPLLGPGGGPQREGLPRTRPQAGVREPGNSLWVVVPCAGQETEAQNADSGTFRRLCPAVPLLCHSKPGGTHIEVLLPPWPRPISECPPRASSRTLVLHVTGSSAFPNSHLPGAGPVPTRLDTCRPSLDSEVPPALPSVSAAVCPVSSHLTAVAHLFSCLRCAA